MAGSVIQLSVRSRSLHDDQEFEKELARGTLHPLTNNKDSPPVTPPPVGALTFNNTTDGAGATSKDFVQVGSVRHILVSFCRWTSVRGMQHVVRTEYPFMSFVWGIFVVIMLVANMVLVALLIKRYFNFLTIENIKTVRNISEEFPSVTVCNVDPINTDRVFCLRNFSEDNLCNMSRKNVTILKAYTLIQKFMDNNNSVVSMLEDPSRISVLYQLIGIEAASLLGHQADDFILREFCYVTYVDGLNILRISCTQANVSIDQLMNYKHFNCYTLTIRDSKISKQTIRLSMVLYLDEEEDFTCKPYCTHEFTEWSGGKVVVHPQGTFPEIDRRGMNLLPGASNQLLIHETRRTESKDLKGNRCEVDKSKVLRIQHLGQNRSERVMTYTSSLCNKIGYQIQTMKICNCIDSMLPIPAETGQYGIVGSEHMPFCGNLSAHNVSSNLRCKRNVKLRFSNNILDKCHLPCDNLEYFVELTQLRWPQKPQILNYYKKLKDRIYYQKFQLYETIDLLTQNESTQKMAIKLLQNTNLFENNFLQLDINRPGYDVVIKYQENEEYTLTTVLSQIGGICSIFLGFTFVTILELIELAYRVFWSIRNRPKLHSNNKAHDDYNDQGGYAIKS